MRTLQRIGLGVGGGIALAAAGLTISYRRFEQRIKREVRDLLAQATAAPTIVQEAELAHLPAVVQRWLHSAGVVGQPRSVTVRLKQRGTFRRAPDAAWMPFTAQQYYTTEPPGFIWSTTMKMMPLVWLQGRDRFTNGAGQMQIRLMSLVPVVNAHGPELTQGTLLRYLNEIMWFPSAALSPYITWSGIDENAARATIDYAGLHAEATFYFNATGDLVDMIAQRSMERDGTFTLQTWSTPVADYRTFHGRRIPTAGTGIWHLAAGDFAYIRPEIIAIEDNVVAPY